jgi:hypothetical protein
MLFLNAPNASPNAGGCAVLRLNVRIWISMSLCLAAASCMLPERPGRENVVNIPLLFTYASGTEEAEGDEAAGAGGGDAGPEEDRDAFGLNILFGIYQRDVHAEGSSSRLFPFYFSSRGPGDASFLLIPPFYYHKRRPYREDTFYFLFGKQWKEGRDVYHPLWPLIKYAPRDEAGRKEFFLFPLIDLERDGPKGSLDILDVLGLVKLFGHTWGYPPEPGGDGSRGSFALLNVLNIIQLAGGNDLGGYEDFNLVTLFGSERISLFQRHWKRDGGDGRTVLFPVYWHLKDDEGEVYNFWPLCSTASGDGWSRKGIASDIITYKNKRGRKTLTLFWFIPISWGKVNDSSLESP